MTILDDFGDVMNTAISVANPSTSDRSMFGVRTVAAGGVTYQAHVEEVNGSNRRLSGYDDYCSSVAWLASTSTANMSGDSVFTLPDGSTPPVRQVTYPRDENGNVHHTKVVFG